MAVRQSSKYRRALWLSIVCCALVSMRAMALDAPLVDIASSGDGRVRIALRGDAVASGYNVYRDGLYRNTRRPASGVRSFEVHGPAGEYCVVAFVEAGTSTAYSPCSTKVRVSMDAASDALEPAPVANLRGGLYSPTSGELFWDASPDHTRLSGYEIRREGTVLGMTQGKSRFEPALPRGGGLDYEVVAIARNGKRSAPARFRLGSRADTASAVARSSAGDLVLESPDRVRLVEGDSKGTDVRIRVRGAGADRGRIRFELLPESGAATRQLVHRLERGAFDAGGDTVTLHLELGIDIAPIRHEERRFRLRVLDDGRSADIVLIAGVEPVAADDVYLLIGQSNMEGYSERSAKRDGNGEPDEPIDRIRQLNVQPNSRGVFTQPGAFTDEQRNLSDPPFIKAEDPLHEPRGPQANRKGGTFVGAGLSFAKSALNRTSRTIYLVPAAWSASGFCANGLGDIAWNASRTGEQKLGGTLLVERALKRLAITLRDTGGILRGILWHQGGADSNDATCAARYGENLQRLAERLRREARVDPRGTAARRDDAPIPFIVATQSRGADERGDFSRFSESKRQVDAVHRTIADRMPWADHVNNDDLVPPAWPCGQSSCVHFGAEALREQGRRFDAALQRVVEAYRNSR